MLIVIALSLSLSMTFSEAFRRLARMNHVIAGTAITTVTNRADLQISESIFVWTSQMPRTAASSCPSFILMSRDLIQLIADSSPE